MTGRMPFPGGLWRPVRLGARPDGRAMNFISIDFIAFVGLVHFVYWRLRENRSRKNVCLPPPAILLRFVDWWFCGLMLLVTANAWWTGRNLPVLATTGVPAAT